MHVARVFQSVHAQAHTHTHLGLIFTCIQRRPQPFHTLTGGAEVAPRVANKKYIYIIEFENL